MKLNSKDGRLYNSIIEVVNQVMDNYDYDFLVGCNSDKYYTYDYENITVINNNDNIINIVESISLGYYLFERLGLEDIELNINCNKEISNMLMNLDIDLISSESDNLSFKYLVDDEVIASGVKNEGIKINISVEKLINVISKRLISDALDKVIDVNINAFGIEEEYHAIKIAQDLRLNNINVVINKTGAKFDILLDENNLSLGILLVKDNRTNEEIKLDEAEIVDYMLGNI